MYTINHLHTFFYFSHLKIVLNTEAGRATESNPVANSHLCMLLGTFIVPWKFF